ncbi:MAG: SRPBCC family protein [Candidatus Magnetomorum sp.]|nr:SRPBCC family protein [Candidatus Magnetomorum sp.]
MRVSFLSILLISLFIPFLTHASFVPKFQDQNIHINDLVKLSETGQLLLLHPEKKVSLPIGNEKINDFDVRFLTSICVIEAPVHRVREVVMDFSHYHEFMPQTSSSTILSKSKNHVINEIKLSVKVPLIHIGVKFTLDYFMEPDGDISWFRVKGDMKGNVGRYEFISLGPNRTMLIMTYWTELRGIGFLMRLLLRAQPDLEMAIPVSTGSLILDAIKKRCELTAQDVPPDINTISKLPKDPIIPVLTQSNIPVDTIQLLSRIGTLVFVHPVQWIRTENNEPVAVKFVTAAGRMQGPLEAVKPLVSDFSRYSEFMYQVKYAKRELTYDGMMVNWRLKLGFAIFKFYLDFVLDYEWKSNTILLYHCKEGDLEYNYGSWEWFRLSDNQTMTFFTTAIPIGKRAPMILKFTKMIPNSQVVMGASSTVVAIEKMTPWVEDQVLEATNLYQ